MSPRAKTHLLLGALLLPTLVAMLAMIRPDLGERHPSLERNGQPCALPPVGAGAPVEARLDKISRRCLECHAELRRDLETRGIVFSGSRIANHPVGVSYWDAWRSKPRELRPAASLSRRIALPAGRITCISCHRADYRTAGAPRTDDCPESEGTTVPRRSLCTACHRM